jgi:predicted metal-binding membrane protein
MRTGRVLRRIIAWVAIGLVVLAGLAYALVEWRWTRRFEAPLPAISASSDPTIVERGRYLVFGPAACAYCHVPREQWDVLAAGTVLPLSGTISFDCRSGRSTRRT